MWLVTTLLILNEAVVDFDIIPFLCKINAASFVTPVDSIALENNHVELSLCGV